MRGWRDLIFRTALVKQQWSWGSLRPLARQHDAGSLGDPLKLLNLKRKSTQKVAVLATGSVSGTVTATPSAATQAPGAPTQPA